MNWYQYSKRRGKMSLQDFLIGCNSKQKALDRFATMDIEPPHQLLDEFFNMKSIESNQVSPTQPDEIPRQDKISEQSVTTTKKSKVSSGSSNN